MVLWRHMLVLATLALSLTLLGKDANANGDGRSVTDSLTLGAWFPRIEVSSHHPLAW